MDDYLRNFSVQIKERADEELKEMLSHPDDYAPKALEIIKKEMHRRGLMESYVSNLSDEELLKLVTSPSKDDSPALIEEAKNEAAKRGSIGAIRQRVMESKREVYGRFRKVKVKPIKRFGQFRGEGTLHATEDGLLISGRHVFSLGVRWGIGLGMFIGFLFITAAATGGTTYFVPGFIPLYFLLEYGILKREELLVPYTDIILYVAAPRRRLIGIDFRGPAYCSPVAMKTDQWKDMLDFLREKAPGANVSLT